MNEKLRESENNQNKTFKGTALRILRKGYTPGGVLISFFPMRVQRDDGSSARREVYLLGDLNAELTARILPGSPVVVEGIEYIARKMDSNGNKIKSGQE